MRRVANAGTPACVPRLTANGLRANDRFGWKTEIVIAALDRHHLTLKRPCRPHSVAGG